MKRSPFAVLAAVAWLFLVNGWALYEASSSGAFDSYTSRQWAQATGGWFELAVIIVGLLLMQRWAMLLLALDVVVVLVNLSQHPPTINQIVSSLSTYAIVAALTLPYWKQMTRMIGAEKPKQDNQ